MSTEHNIMKCDEKVTLCLEEHSSLHDLYLDFPNGLQTVKKDMTAEQLIELAKNILKVTSYSYPDEVDKFLKDHQSESDLY